MKYIEYSVTDIKNNLKNNLREMLIILVFFVLLGIGVGILQNINYKQQKYTMEDTIVDEINYNDYVKDETYYYNTFCEVKSKYNALYAYVSYLRQVEMSNENTHTLELLDESLSQFKKEYYDKINHFYIDNTPIICDDITKAKKFITDNIEQKERVIAVSDKTIERLNNHPFSKFFSETSETRELEKIQIEENEKEFWERQLNMVCNLDLEKVKKINQEMDRLLQNLEVRLNDLVLSFNNFISDIESQEQYDIIYNKYFLKLYLTDAGVTGELSEEDIMNNRRNNAVIYAKSIAGVDVAKERFFAFLTFFILFGVAITILYGAFWNGRKINSKNEK